MKLDDTNGPQRNIGKLDQILESVEALLERLSSLESRIAKIEGSLLADKKPGAPFQPWVQPVKPVVYPSWPSDPYSPYGTTDNRITWTTSNSLSNGCTQRDNKTY